MQHIHTRTHQEDMGVQKRENFMQLAWKVGTKLKTRVSWDQQSMVWLTRMMNPKETKVTLGSAMLSHLESCPWVRWGRGSSTLSTGEMFSYPVLYRTKDSSQAREWDSNSDCLNRIREASYQKRFKHPRSSSNDNKGSDWSHWFRAQQYLCHLGVGHCADSQSSHQNCWIGISQMIITRIN